MFRHQTICMSMKLFYPRRFASLVFFLLAVVQLSNAQDVDCSFKGPIIKIDFGNDARPQNFSLSQLKQYYRGTTKDCPDDGEFSFTSHTTNCFFGNWVAMAKDHTPGSVNGRMMLVNASYTPASFFSVAITDLKPNTTYELSAWFVNVCLGTEGCMPTPPQIRVSFFAGGKRLSAFYTGEIPPTSPVAWRRFAGTFTTPASFSGITVAMEDLVSGGCGNDFAMDDIEVRECIIKQPPPTVQKPLPAPVAKQVPKENEPRPLPKQQMDAPAIPSKQPANISKTVTPANVSSNKPAIKPVVPNIAVPDVIKTRENSIAGTIETPPSDILIELYDNGEIDGDTVTIYHNNKLLVSHAGLSVKPVALTIKVDKENPYHELVMAADNLGSIPPNTALMVVTTKYKRQEVFISSSEKKNAKLLIRLAEGE